MSLLQVPSSLSFPKLSPLLPFPFLSYPNLPLSSFNSLCFHFIISIQATNFGALLDMITDRCGTVALTFCLCIFYPSWLIMWQLVAALDISSHWYHTATTYLLGGKSHKEGHTNPLLIFFNWNVSFVVEYAP